MLDSSYFHPLSVITTSRLNIRKGAPRRSAPIQSTIERGTILTVLGEIAGEEVFGNDDWYRLDGDGYVWAGGCRTLTEPETRRPEVSVGQSQGVTDKRPDGTIRPLDNAGLRRVFGSFAYTEAAKGAIVIDRSWVQRNIVSLDTPLLADVGYPKLWLHRKAAPSYAAVLAEIQRQGLSGLILTCGGTFVPRHINHDPARALSSHSWGAAIDLNVKWNGVGVTPPAEGDFGSLRELVPIFAAHGFAWGGDFSGRSVDGMHFELARTDL